MSEIPQSSSAVATKQRIGLAVSLYVGFAVLTAGAVGGSLAAALFIKPGTPTPTPIPMKVSYVQTASVQLQSAGSPTISFFTWEGVNRVDFGALFGSTTIFTPGNQATSRLPLGVTVTNPHPAMVVVIAANATESGNVYSLIPTAHAQVQVGTASSICIPAVNAANSGALININTNTNQSTTTYYIDANGNAYANPNLTGVLNPVPCETVLQKAMIADGMTGATLNAAYPSDASPMLGLYAGGYPIGALTSNTTTVTPVEDPNNDHPYPGAKSPLTMILGSTQTQPISAPSRVLQPRLTVGTVVSSSQDLCIPTFTLPGSGGSEGNAVAFFYDRFGNPYTDIFLSQRAACILPPTPVNQ
ncbi:MAG: hypothetical protein WCV85_04505 [Patescibacteria group bacterium]|jgi:hypothetical protein